MSQDLISKLMKAIEGKAEGFESAFKQAEGRKTQDGDTEPIAFVFPNQDEIPEHLRKHLDNFTGVMADLFGKHVTPDNSDEAVTETEPDTSTGEGQDDVSAHRTAYTKLSPFSLVEGHRTLTVLVQAVGFSEQDISIRFVDDELIVNANTRSNNIEVSGHKILAGDVSELLRPIYVRLPMPDVDKEKTEFTLSNGLLQITLVKAEPKSNVFIVK